MIACLEIKSEHITFTAVFVCQALQEDETRTFKYSDERKVPRSKVTITCTNGFDLGKKKIAECIANPKKKDTGMWSPEPELSLCITGILYILYLLNVITKYILTVFVSKYTKKYSFYFFA